MAVISWKDCKCDCHNKDVYAYYKWHCFDCGIEAIR